MGKVYCIIYDCEFDRYQEGIVVDNIVYAIDDDGNKEPARECICQYVDFGMVQFFTGYNAKSGGYHLRNNGSKWGYFELSTGSVVVPPKYDYAGPFYGDRAMVSINSKYGFIDSYGNEVVDIKWDESQTTFHKAPSWVRSGDKYGYIDKHGAVVIPLQFELAKSFETIEGSYKDNHYAALIKKDGKYGYIDENGNYIFEPIFEETKAFWYVGCNPTKRYAPVKASGMWGFIDLRGEFIVDFQFVDIGQSDAFDTGNNNRGSARFETDRAQFYTVKKNGQWALIDDNFDIIMQEEGQRYAVYSDRRVYMRDGRVTSIRKLKVKKV